MKSNKKRISAIAKTASANALHYDQNVHNKQDVPKTHSAPDVTSSRSGAIISSVSVNSDEVIKGKFYRTLKKISTTNNLTDLEHCHMGACTPKLIIVKPKPAR